MHTFSIGKILAPWSVDDAGKCSARDDFLWVMTSGDRAFTFFLGSGSARFDLAVPEPKTTTTCRLTLRT
jgi:hypothetical protein